jgi:hypothetical protein
VLRYTAVPNVINLNNQQSPLKRAFLEKLTVPEVVEKFPALYGT